MVHNGIEYGDMQLICEAYHLMKDVLGMTQDEMADVCIIYRHVTQALYGRNVVKKNLSYVTYK